jgi:hypothetical protein
LERDLLSPQTVSQIQVNEGMGMHEETRKCAHPACICTVSNDTKYCSQYCKDAGETMELSCNCGHAGCVVSERQPAMGA